MATHSNILDWRIPWTEEPGMLQSLGCKESDTLKKHFQNTLKVHFTDRSVKILGPTIVNLRVISAHLEGH